jgi:hypothetical protein
VECFKRVVEHGDLRVHGQGEHVVRVGPTPVCGQGNGHRRAQAVQWCQGLTQETVARGAPLIDLTDFERTIPQKYQPSMSFSPRHAQLTMTGWTLSRSETLRCVVLRPLRASAICTHIVWETRGF